MSEPQQATFSEPATRLPTRQPVAPSGAADAHSVLAGIDGVLELLERQSETSDASFNAFCLLALVRERLEGVLREGVLR